MDHRVISFVAGFRAGAIGAVTGALLGPALGVGVAGLLMAVSATKSEDGVLRHRRTFSTGAGLTGLFAAVALAGSAAWALIQDNPENTPPATTATPQIRASVPRP